MSLPPPPGLKKLPSSLPPRPPQPAYSSAPSYSSPGTAPGVASSGYGANQQQRAPGTGYNAFTAFQPRSVASNQAYRTSSPIVSGPTPPATTSYPPSTTGYSAAYQNPQQSYQAGASYYGQPTYGDGTYGPSPVPQITNPFPVPGQDQSNAYGARGKAYGRNDSGMDPELEAQIAQWQSAYISKDGDSSSASAKGAGRSGTATATSANAGASTASSNTSTAANTPASGAESGQKTVIRSGGGQTWTDPTLLEWDPAHFRLFVGNLAGEVTDESLKKAFSKYPSVQKARVIRDKRTEKSKGYGFVSFSDGDDYFKAAREMQGKYIGSHPVLLRRATTEIKPVVVGKGGKKGGNGGGGAGGGQGGASSGKAKSDGVKKQKTKGGLKILG
ncbi:hypothetical protein VTN96DRAFT_567 [Rasamsonia emersonii]|uniref:RNP domain protein n=1 Tax=Rasamsonia emersonii (strain ATCC 16479 / CBS 393.64 / IMI 116815) TaxID=1408163 RepID=A0A0F4YXW9_RASE3|nr:RNP domain protein [Rasamsonia emersonii CBS 393.64]KKA23099.1 RNP domain protein [Rasamsonia emersonii CBS 393.64]